MKYLILLPLLILTSCATTQENCEYQESGMILNSKWSVYYCKKLPFCDDADIWCINNSVCTKDVQTNEKYTCIERD